MDVAAEAREHAYARRDVVKSIRDEVGAAAAGRGASSLDGECSLGGREGGRESTSDRSGDDSEEPKAEGRDMAIRVDGKDGASSNADNSDSSPRRAVGLVPLLQRREGEADAIRGKRGALCMIWLWLPHAVGFPLVCGALGVLPRLASSTLLGLAIRRRPGLILGIKAPSVLCRPRGTRLLPLSLPVHRISP